MLKASNIEDTQLPAQLFAALGDSTRLQLVNRLKDGQHNSISSLSAGMKLSRQGVSKHLRVLEKVGIVESTRVGREIQFALKPESFTPLQSYLELVSLQWDQAIERLQTLVEEK
ncbi:MAG: transcriptional regulator [Pseudohongiella sp.]|nr:MAG: transcriptional regulator [Pseudohongiella sp.]